jgi:hypothetical protein
MRRRVVAVAAGALAVIGIVLGVVLSQGTDGPPPLGNPATWSPGLECSLGTTVADGFYPIENPSDEAVTITSVRLVGGPGQAMTSPAYLVPWNPNGHPLIGLLPPWPPNVPWWSQRRLAVGATIPAHGTANLVFKQTRTSDQPNPAEPQFTYTADGSSYTVTERFQTVVVTRNCEAVLKHWRPPASYPS